MSPGEHYSDLFELAPYACLVTDAAGEILEANRESGELLDGHAAQLAGKALDAFIPMEQNTVFRGRVAAMAGGLACKRSWRGAIVRAQGTRVDVEFTVGCIRRDTTTLLCWMLRPALPA
jgi:PAS domain S-box-containing protein